MVNARKFMRGFLTAREVQDEPFIGTIAAARPERLHDRWHPDDKEPKLVLYFENGRRLALDTDPGLGALIRAWGQETDQWIGRQVIVDAEWRGQRPYKRIRPYPLPADESPGPAPELNVSDIKW